MTWFDDTKFPDMVVDVTPNLQFQRSGNSRLRRLLPPAELGRWASKGESNDVSIIR